MLGALIITLPCTLYGIWVDRLIPWALTGVLLGALFNWGIS